MKQKLYILGLSVVMITLMGGIFKLEHWPGGSILMAVGILVLVWIFLPLALVNSFSSKLSGSRFLYITGWITCMVVFTALLFKVMHWPGSGLLLTIALPFPYVVFLPVFLTVTGRDRGYNIYNTVFILLLLAANSVFSAILALR